MKGAKERNEAEAFVAVPFRAALDRAKEKMPR
jgi:hypothetical protein